MNATWEIRQGDALEVLRALPDESVHCVVTSPPYYGLRDYGSAKQLGLEQTLSVYIERMLTIFCQVHRVLRKDGVLWLNLGDSYAGSWGAQGRRGSTRNGSSLSRNQIMNHPKTAHRTGTIRDAGLKPKDLMGIPWRTALALQQAGWWLRSDVIWSKPNPMPESVTDRPTKAHEYLFLLTKSKRYFYNAAAVSEPVRFPKDNQPEDHERAYSARRMNGPVHRQEPYRSGNKERRYRADHGGPADSGSNQAHSVPWEDRGSGRNKRSVWAIDEDEFAQFLAWKAARESELCDVWPIATEPFAGAHFATFPTKLVEPCILAGCPEGGTVLDPFAGSGTTLMVALRHNRNAIGIELNPEYVALARARIIADAPLLNGVTC